jgi:short-chain fatty acids transporter
VLRVLGRRFEAFFRATAPDPLVLAVVLGAVTFLVALALTDAGPVGVLRAWAGPRGVFGLLAFSMQMALILVTGHALASAPPVQRLLRRLAAVPRSGPQAAALVALVAGSAALLNWGLGLIIGALFAREVGRSCAARAVPHHYPLLAAAGYSGLMLWHGGLSGSAPLKMTTPPDVAQFLGEELAAEVGVVPFTDTVLSVPNLVISVGLLGLVVGLVAQLHPKAEEARGVQAYGLDEPSREPAAGALRLPERIAASPLTMLLLLGPLLGASVLFFIETGIGALDPNALNLLFLTAGLLLHGSLASYRDAVGEAIAGTAGIVLQFPLYAGIMGIMRDTGLAVLFAETMAATASATLYPVLTFLSAGFVNLFVPSGGGQWAVQGPLALEAAHRLGLAPAQVIMAVAYGDQCTNMLQPFWALPLLAITKVEARDIVGFTALIMIAGALWMILGLLLWPTLAG